MIDRTNAERQKRYIARLKAKAKAADAAAVNNAEIAKLKDELARAQAVSNGEIAALKTELAQAKGRIRELTNRTPRALPPDEARERELKGLRTRIRNLSAELRWLRDERNTVVKVMLEEERKAIIKALHPDRVPTERQRSDALQHFNAWNDRQSKRRS